MGAEAIETAPPTFCERMRIACERKRMQEREEDHKIAADHSAGLRRVEEKLDEFLTLNSRVVALELWKSGLDGAAAEAVKNARAHHRDGEGADHPHQRSIDAVAVAVITALKSEGLLRPFDIGSWARANWKLMTAFSVGALLLAAVAGIEVKKMLWPPVKAGVEQTLGVPK